MKNAMLKIIAEKSTEQLCMLLTEIATVQQEGMVLIREMIVNELEKKM